MRTRKQGDPRRPLLRLASRIAARLSAAPPGGPLGGELDRRRETVAAKARLLALAEARGWGRAAESLRDDLAYHLGRLAEEARAAADRLRRPRPAPPRIGDVLGELRQLAEEFDDVRLDARAGAVSAVVGPVTLGDVGLGRFRLSLDVGGLGPCCGAGCVRAEALDPNPASCDRTVTHPHVRDGRVCAGEGEQAAAAALREGRIFDAFAVLRGVLMHYAEDSPYVRLDAWDGSSCDACGTTVPSGDTYFCGGCHSDVCDGCSSVCRCCEDVRCDGCLDPCPACRRRCCSACREATGPDDREVCPDCRKKCPDCEEEFVKDELHAESGLCDECREKRAQDDRDEQADQDDQDEQAEAEEKPKVAPPTAAVA
jgi:hypothetical protein